MNCNLASPLAKNFCKLASESKIPTKTESLCKGILIKLLSNNENLGEPTVEDKLEP